MGTRYADIGRLRIVHVDAKTSTAIRGNRLRRDAARRSSASICGSTVPQFHNTKLDPFAAPSGKKTAMVVSAKDYQELAGAGNIVYVNLGGEQGVSIGDYFRVFRYQGIAHETNYMFKDTAYKVYGFGSTPVAYDWNDLPREVLGEGIVLRTGPNSSTVLLTDSRSAIYAGDYVEVE